MFFVNLSMIEAYNPKFGGKPAAWEALEEVCTLGRLVKGGGNLFELDWLQGFVCQPY